MQTSDLPITNISDQNLQHWGTGSTMTDDEIIRHIKTTRKLQGQAKDADKADDESLTVQLRQEREPHWLEATVDCRERFDWIFRL
jgi:hypothetical protein